MNKKMISTFFLGALLATGCGGGGSSSGGSGGGGGGGSTPGLSITASPTATFTSSQADADALAKEIQDGTPALIAAVSMQNIPAGISTLPAGVSGSISCASLSDTGTGSGTLTYDTNNTSATPTAGTYVNATYTNCTFDVTTTTFTLNGTTTMTYTRYNSSTDYAVTVSYSSFTMSIVDTSNSINDTYGPISGSYVLDVNGSTITMATQLPNGGVTNLLVADVSYNGNIVTITSATYVYNSSSAGGIIKVDFTNWTYDTTTGIPVSGTITVTDANGNTMVITANGDNTATVTFTVDGSVTAYTVTFP